MLLIILVVLALVCALYVVSVYNSLAKKKNIIDTAMGDIHIQLTRRYDLIPNLIETVKGAASFEKSTLEAVIAARNSAMNTSEAQAGDKFAAEGMLSSALKQMFALAESYPDLKATGNFASLQAELSQIEETISSARRYWNAAVREYNEVIVTVPSSLVARMFAFAKIQNYEAVEDAQQNVKVSF